MATDFWRRWLDRPQHSQRTLLTSTERMLRPPDGLHDQRAPSTNPKTATSLLTEPDNETSHPTPLHT